MELIHGRPETNEGRLSKEIRVYDLLDSLGISFERVDHAPAMTMEVCAAIDEVLEATICKNLLLCNRQGTAFYLLMLPGNKVFKTSVLSKQIGSSRLSFATAEDMQELLGVQPGSASILSLMNDPDHRVTLAIDRQVIEPEHFGCHPCRNTSSVKLKTADVLETFLKHTGHEPLIVEL
mgnify:CR=1 FL=1